MNPCPKQKPIRLKGKAYKDLQVAVLKRDNFACISCGRHTEAPPHHVIFRSQGGSDTMENMVTLCMECHEKEHR